MITGITQQRSSLDPEFHDGSSGSLMAPWGAFLLSAGIALSGVIAGTGTTSSVPTSQVRYVDSWTSMVRTVGPTGGAVDPARAVRPEPASGAEESKGHSTAGVGASEGQPALNHQDAIRWLKDTSGLTWDQLGRMFGVSRRAVHLWANGGRMNAGNAETLHELVSVVGNLPETTADGRRVALLALGTDGRSVVDRYRGRQASSAGEVSGTPMTPDQLLGALHGDAAE